ncbi:MAG TPA: hypothetical protein VLA21_07445, partial [Candidatus Limnocylindria bacterium]|nr:hypothetical protein [Candidatus Limnocylindria bacterium]
MRKPAPRLLHGYVLPLLLLLTLLTTGVSFARYQTTLAATGTVRVAKPVVELVMPPPSAFSGLRPGAAVNASFSVKNNDGAGAVSEVTMRYRITAVPQDPGALPQQYACTIRDAGGNTVSPDTWFTLGHSAAQEHQYTLSVVWNAGMNGVEYQNLQQAVNVLLSA